MMFSVIGNTDHDACTQIIHRALDAGTPASRSARSFD